MKHMKIILVILPLLIYLIPVIAQEKAKETGPFKTTMSFICTSTSDDSIQLKAVISVKHESGATLLANASIDFHVIGKESESNVGNAKTDMRGTAILKIPAKGQYERDEQQMIQFKAVYGGDSNYESSEGEFGLKPAKLAVSFYEEDSIKYVKVEAFQYELSGAETPLGSVDVSVSVPKMFSMLKIGQISLDSTGIGTMEFPAGIIGDSLGNLIFVASIDEHEIYGFVQGSSVKNWGIRKHLISPDRPSRELWTPIAPLWMIITLIIMLAGVWGHYVYAIVQLVMIKKSSKKPEEKEEPTV
jgi:hypothetical protein